MKIFGREPAALVGVIEAALVLLMTFQVPGLTQANIVNIVAVVTALLGVVTAYYTRDTMLGVLVGLTKALITLAVGYGLPLSDGQTAATIAFVTLTVGFFQRTQTTPAAVPSFAEHGRATFVHTGATALLLLVAAVLVALVQALVTG